MLISFGQLFLYDIYQLDKILVLLLLELEKISVVNEECIEIFWSNTFVICSELQK